MKKRPPVVIIILALVLLVATNAVRAQPQLDGYRVFLPAVYTSPPPDEEMLEPPAVPGAVYVSSLRSFTSGGSRYVVGEVVNATPETAYAIQVDVALYDASGRRIAGSTTYTVIYRLEPGERTGFLWLESTPPAGIAHSEAQVMRWERHAWADYRPISVISSSTEALIDGVRVVGELRNDQAVRLQNVCVEATFYDPAGRVLSVDHAFAHQTTLEVGETSRYTIDTTRIRSFDHMTLRSEGYRYTP